METAYVRTEQGKREIAERLNGLTPQQRTVLILIGTSGKSLGDLRRALSNTSELLEPALRVLIERGLVSAVLSQAEVSLSAVPPSVAPPAIDPLKGARRHLGYLADMIGNSDAKAAFALTLKLRKVSSLDEIEAILPAFHAALSGVRGKEEADLLLGRLGMDECLAG